MLKKVLVLALLVLLGCVNPSFAQSITFTSAQKTTLLADITAKGASGQPLFGMVAAQNWDGIVTYYNTIGSGICWKSSVDIPSVGLAFNAAEMGTRSAADSARLQVLALYLANGVRPYLADHRAFFDDIFSGTGGVNTRASLLALWKRSMTVLEQLFASGAGTNANPATLVIEGQISAQQVSDIVGGR